MDFSIRQAESTDMDAVLQLIQELADFEKEPDAVKISANTLREHGFGPKPLFKCFVAEAGQDIIGMALVYFRFSTWEGKSLHLEDLVISQKHRKKGVGKALYNQVMLYGQQERVKRVEWVVLDWNEDAIRFYEKSGALLLKDWFLVQMNEERLEKYIATF